MHVARRTTDDDGRQPIAIDHLSDSGDLIKKLESFCSEIDVAVPASMTALNAR